MKPSPPPGHWAYSSLISLCPSEAPPSCPFCPTQPPIDLPSVTIGWCTFSRIGCVWNHTVCVFFYSAFFYSALLFMLLHIWLLCSFLLLSSILPYEYTTVGLSINMLMDIWVVSSLELLEIQLQWMFIYQYKTLCEYMFLRFLGMKWLAHVSNFKKKPAKLLPRIAESFYISTYSFSLSLSTFGIDWSFKF